MIVADTRHHVARRSHGGRDRATAVAVSAAVQMKGGLQKLLHAWFSEHVHVLRFRHGTAIRVTTRVTALGRRVTGQW
jgi:hypothetical protein